MCVGKGEAIETTLAALQVVSEPFRSFANTLVDVCAYAGNRLRPPKTSQKNNNVHSLSHMQTHNILLMLPFCTHSGSGNVLKVQQLLHICSEHYDTKDKEDDKDKKDKKDKEKKENTADMGSHQVCV